MDDFDEWMQQKSSARAQQHHSLGITPLAKKIAEENLLEWKSLKGSGADGLILERDVLLALAKKS
ncbi:MAG: E3 binding domain-containing protein [Deinococcales bacterium]